VRRGADGQWEDVGAAGEGEVVRRYRLANRPFELVDVGLGRIVALHCRSSTSYQIY
jgi:hypothetical protein